MFNIFKSKKNKQQKTVIHNRPVKVVCVSDAFSSVNLDVFLSFLRNESFIEVVVENNVDNPYFLKFKHDHFFDFWDTNSYHKTLQPHFIILVFRDNV